jgi:hypothetical protein
MPSQITARQLHSESAAACQHRGEETASFESGGTAQSQKDVDWFRSHGRQIREVHRQGASGDLGGSQLGGEVHASDLMIHGNGPRTVAGQNGGVIAKAIKALLFQLLAKPLEESILGA